MPKNGKKKAINPAIEAVQKAIDRKMHRQPGPHMFICKHDLDQVWAEQPLREVFPSFNTDEIETIRRSYICILSILVYVDWTDLRNRFRPTFLREIGREDKHLPFTDLAFLGPSRQAFSSCQHAFKPVVIEEHGEKYIQEVSTEHRLPFIDETQSMGMGGYGSVTKRTIAPRCLWNKGENKDNPEPTVVACKTYISENRLEDFQKEVRNLDYIKESLTYSKRVMVHVAAIVHGNEFMIILPYANLHDLEIFLRGGYEPNPNTDNSKKVYDFGTVFPLLDTSIKLQNAIIEEALQLASALKWLHQSIRVSDSSDCYLAHMDLKPANVLLVSDARSPAGKWMLSDFGVSSFYKATNAKVSDKPAIRDVGPRLTSRGFKDRISRGKGPYQPPEVDLENVDSRKCDVWSFSCVLCDILAFALGRKEDVNELRGLRYDRNDDLFYRTRTLTESKTSEINDSNTELKPQIVEWLDDKVDQNSSSRWVINYVEILRKALKPTPSKRPDITALVHGLEEVFSPTRSQEGEALTPEPETFSNNPHINGSPPQQHLTLAQQKNPSITVSSESSPPHSETLHPQRMTPIDEDRDQFNLPSPESVLHQQLGPSSSHEEDSSENRSGIEVSNTKSTHTLDTLERSSVYSPDGSSSARRTSSASIIAFRERPKITVSLPKKEKVKAVAITPTPLKVAILCKHSVHLYSMTENQETTRRVDLTPKVDWTKIRLASQYFAVYGLLSHVKQIEIFDLETLETISTEAAITDNHEMPQDILLSAENVIAYVYGRSVKLYFARRGLSPRPIRLAGDDAFIVQAKFGASGKFLCLWTIGTRADHAYFIHVDEERASARLCGEGSYRKIITNPGSCDIWPYLDSPACLVHDTHGDTFIAQPLDPPKAGAYQRNSIGIPNVLAACVFREHLLVFQKPKMLRSEKLLCDFALSQEPKGQHRIVSLSRVIGSADKDIEQSTATAVNIVDGKSELVLCTTTGKVLRYAQS